jgi:hypothetical protein
MELTPDQQTAVLALIKQFNEVAVAPRLIRAQALACLLVAEEDGQSEEMDALLTSIRARVPQAKADLAELIARN